LVNTFGLERAKIVSVPVPIIVSSKSLSKKKRPRTIGFLGRIHKDRGIWQFIELVEKLNIENTFFKVIVAGDGPERVKFLSRLQNVIPENRLQYLGQIKNKELQNTWKSIGVLVSMAPVESYGRVLRESLLAGVPVWATPSSGVYDLLDIAEPGTLLQIRLNDDSIKLNKEFEFLLKANISSKFRNRFIKENSSYAERLVNSWIATIETHKRYKLKKFVN
jgi:glycosyltransferase involved in cell wall biosynthesis